MAVKPVTRMSAWLAARAMSCDRCGSDVVGTTMAGRHGGTLAPDGTSGRCKPSPARERASPDCCSRAEDALVLEVKGRLRKASAAVTVVR